LIQGCVLVGRFITNEYNEKQAPDAFSCCAFMWSNDHSQKILGRAFLSGRLEFLKSQNTPPFSPERKTEAIRKRLHE
jgi:hypothetical protein